MFADKWSDASGAAIYDALENVFDSKMKASLFLLRAGIDGIKYPAGSLSGMKTDAFNYVVFDENAVTVEQHSVFEEEGEYGEEEEDDSFDFGALIPSYITSCFTNGATGSIYLSFTHP